MRHSLQWIKGGSKDGKPGYLLTFDYDPDVITELKQRIPHEYREWRPDDK